jgi:AcrR family transcriptional regulator
VLVQKAENARERFESAAFNLFRERGYAATTVPEIATLAGLTERTFYRYFSDKREVMFWRAGAHQASIAAKIEAAPMEPNALRTVAHAFKAIAPFIDSHARIVRMRQQLIATQGDLHERELLKLYMLTSAIAGALQKRHVAPQTSRVIAEIGTSIWRMALENWRNDTEQASFAEHVDGVLAEFEAGIRTLFN